MVSPEIGMAHRANPWHLARVAIKGEDGVQPLADPDPLAGRASRTRFTDAVWIPGLGYNRVASSATYC